MSFHPPVREIVIVGGGTAGWMTAAALARVLGPAGRLRLVESDQIGTIGVGEATLPHLAEFNRALGIDEDEFVRATQGTFKLGIEFVDWDRPGDRYVHGFGRLAQPGGMGFPFHHLWTRMARRGLAAPLEAYSINTAAARTGRFLRPRAAMAGSPLAELAHAFHFDAGRYARFLRGLAEKMGARRTEGRIVRVTQRAADGGPGAGHIESLVLQDGEVVTGDLFIDCSGLHGLLIEQALHAGWEDWSHWLPCDRAVAVPCEQHAAPIPLTRSTARRAGWQWRIPLQHRIGNGHVYASAFMSDDEAVGTLLGNLDGAPLADPRVVRFRAGRRRSAWVGNCVSVGLASGFLEPLESTSIHMIQTAIARLLHFFPRTGFDAADIAQYNAMTAWEAERIRDFIILHYKATRRDDSAFWDHCRTMDVPDSLQRRIDLFCSNGRVFRDGEELFVDTSWVQVMLGQGLFPQAHHPFADAMPEADALAQLKQVEQVIERCVAVMPPHADFIAAHCAAAGAMEVAA